MARDPLVVLWRLRDTAVTEASAALASSRASLRVLCSQLDEHSLQTQYEQSQTECMESAAFSIWLPHARTHAMNLQNQVRSEEARVLRLLQTLTQRRTEAEAVSKALEQQRAAAATVLARHEQEAMDEAAGNSYRCKIRQ